jgi:hypothetical protein
MKSFTLSAAVVSTTLCLAMQSSFAQLVVTPDSNANDLANTILGAGVTINSASYSGADAAVGTFTGGNSPGTGLGINSGIVITSGFAVNTVGPNTSTGITGDNGEPGSALLSQLIGGQATEDAAILTITFTTATAGNFFFNYVFGSDEYNEYVNQFDDVFGFFLDGSAVANNVALIPGTSTPVSINTVNNGVNSGYYRDNTDGHLNLQYDGLTVPLSVTVSNLAAGPHTIQIGVADALDWVLDSGVFIQAGTFGTNQVPTDAPDAASTFALLGAAFSGMAMLRRKK